MEHLPTDIYTEMGRYLSSTDLARLRRTSTATRAKSEKAWQEIEAEKQRQYDRPMIYFITDRDILQQINKYVIGDAVERSYKSSILEAVANTINDLYDFPEITRGDVVIITKNKVDYDTYRYNRSDVYFFYDGTKLIPQQSWFYEDSPIVPRQFAFPEFPLQYFEKVSPTTPAYVWVDLNMNEVVANKINDKLSYVEKNRVRYTVLIEGEYWALQEATELTETDIGNREYYEGEEVYYVTYRITEQQFAKYDPNFSFVLTLGSRKEFYFDV